MEKINHYFPELSANRIEKLYHYKDLLLDWNQKINLISRKDTDNIITRHIIHSLGIYKVFQFQPRTKLLDVGTGGGLPGIPLALVLPQCHFHLIDSKAKKANAVEEMVRTLGLTNVAVDQFRLEEYSGACDFIISRAVTRLHKLVSWIGKDTINREHRNDFPNGMIYLKGGDVHEEIGKISLKVDIYNLSDHFDDKFFQTKKLLHLYP